MSDLKVNLVNNEFDLVIENGEIAKDDSLFTSVSISIFTDARIEDEEAIQIKNKRGWWGDTYLTNKNDKIGSKLWLIFHNGKTNQKILNSSRDYIYDSLKWLIDDGVAKNINVTTELDNEKNLLILVEIFKPDGSIINYEFSNFWDSI